MRVAITEIMDLRTLEEDLWDSASLSYEVRAKMNYKAGLKMNYKLLLAAWYAVNTSVQRVFHPGGRVISQAPDMWAVIV